MLRALSAVPLALCIACTTQARITSGAETGGTGGGGAHPGGSGGDDGTGARGGHGGSAGRNDVDADFTFDPHDGGATSSGDAGQMSCGFQKYELMRRPAELMLVLDRSGSMQEPAGPMSLTSKWTEATAALDETIMKTADRISWGLKMFPSTEVTCALADGIEVPPALDNYQPVTMAYRTAGPNGDGTPTALALKKTVAWLQANPSMKPRYLVLATDGEPTCMDGIDGDLRDDVAAVQAVADAAAAGLHTFVLGIATGQGADMVLNDLAVAGKEPRAGDPRYYPVTSRQDLIGALDLITGIISDCTFPLDKVPPAPDAVAVNVDTTRLTRDPTHVHGWDYGPDGKSIIVYGATCDALKSGAAKNVSIIFGCPGVVIP
jgi:hypothetical protein